MATFPLPLAELLGHWGSYVIYVLVGIAFGFTLESAGFGNSKLLAAQFYFSDLLWPDFNAAELDRAIAAYRKRERRFDLPVARNRGWPDHGRRFYYWWFLPRHLIGRHGHGQTGRGHVCRGRAVRYLHVRRDGGRLSGRGHDRPRDGWSCSWLQKKSKPGLTSVRSRSCLAGANRLPARWLHWRQLS